MKGNQLTVTALIISLLMVSILNSQNYSTARKYDRADLLMNSEDSALARVENLVRDAAEIIADRGKEAAFERFSDQEFTQGHYLFALDMNGNVMAYSNNDNLVGQNIINSIDLNGGYHVHRYIDLMEDSELGWSGYHKYSNNAGNVPVRVFLMKIDSDLFIGCETYAGK